MPRLLFEKKGQAVWISHLDLMRLFQRAFKRAELPLTHTQGFNPRPSVSIALPLSVGVESCCELLDFELYGEPVPNDDICTRLNERLVEGVRVLKVYDGGKKIGGIALLQCQICLEYDDGVPEKACQQLSEFFARECIIVPKKTKNGVQDQNIIPMIRRLHITQQDGHSVLMDALICCQNPTLNPMQLPAAIERYLPVLKADFASCKRIEIFDQQETVFR